MFNTINYKSISPYLDPFPCLTHHHRHFSLHIKARHIPHRRQHRNPKGQSLQPLPSLQLCLSFNTHLLFLQGLLLLAFLFLLLLEDRFQSLRNAAEFLRNVGFHPSVEVANRYHFFLGLRDKERSRLVVFFFDLALSGLLRRNQAYHR
jgi:hypothetical protein